MDTLRKRPCVHANGKPIFVNRIGMFKIGSDGLTRTGTPDTTLRLACMEFGDGNGTVMVPFNRIMASTFAPLPSSFTRYPRVVYTDRFHESYVSGLVTASTLSWTSVRRLGTNVRETDVVLEGEIWRFSETYLLYVSNRERYRYPGGPIMEFIPRDNRPLYGYLSMPYRGKGLTFHKVVADAFLGPMSPSDGHQCVDHIDGNTYNNSPINLRYLSVAENNVNRISRSRPTPSSYNAIDYMWVDAVYYPRPAMAAIDTNAIH